MNLGHRQHTVDTEHWKREKLLREANAAWERIIADPIARAEIEAERALWDNAVADGLDAEDWDWTENVVALNG